MAGRSDKKKEPVERLKAWTGSGTVTVSIWQNDGNADRKNYSVTVQRSYKDDQKQWQNSNFLFPTDILAVGQLLGQAWILINQWEQEDRR